MKAVLDRELVESLNDSSDQEFAVKINTIVFNLVGTALSEIEERSPFIKVDKCVLLPFDEAYTGAFCQLSEYNYILGIDNPEIAFNSVKKRYWWANLWKTFRSYWRIGRKKKKSKKNVDVEKPVTFEKYRLENLKGDLIHRMADYISETSVEYEFPAYITLIGPDDFGPGVKINILIAYFESATETFKVYSHSKNKFKEVNFGTRFAKIDEKTEQVGPMFVNMIKIINQVYGKAYGSVPNQIILESLLYSAPNYLFDSNDVYKTFVNIANYIRFKDPKTIPSICHDDKMFLKDKITGLLGSTSDYPKILSVLDRYKY